MDYYADLPELMVAADKYAIDSLKEECGQHLSQNLTVENAGEYLVLAHRINCVKLRESSLDFMAKNAKAICSRRKEWIEIINNYPELCFEVMQLMANVYISIQKVCKVFKFNVAKLSILFRNAILLIFVF